MGIARAFLPLLLLLGCTQEPPATRIDPHFGTTTYSSSTHLAGASIVSSHNVRAVMVERSKSTTCSLLTYITRNDLTYPKIETVRAFGNTLPYARIDRHRAGPLRAEAGRIMMSCKEFARLATVGIEFRMYGPRGVYSVSAPARLFSEALAQKAMPNG